MAEFISRKLLAGLSLTTMACILPLAAHAEADYPQRPVTITVPFPPGGATDLLTRVVGDRLAQKWGQPVIIDNRPGGGTLIGSEAVARAKPDGYHLLMNISSLIQAPHLRSSVVFEPTKALDPITEAATLSLIVVANNQEPSNTPAELVENVRANPGKYSYGSYGAGSSGHMYMHIFNEQNGLDMVHVAYRGEAPSVTDLIGGQVPLVIMSGIGALPHLKTGKMKALAVTGPERAKILPDVPTFKELGYTGMAERGWFGFFAPAGTPKSIIDKVSADINEILKEPAVIERLEPTGLVLLGSTPEAFRTVVERDNEKWGQVIRDSGVRVD